MSITTKKEIINIVNALQNNEKLNLPSGQNIDLIVLNRVGNDFYVDNVLIDCLPKIDSPSTKGSALYIPTLNLAIDIDNSSSELLELIKQIRETLNYIAQNNAILNAPNDILPAVALTQACVKAVASLDKYINKVSS